MMEHIYLPSGRAVVTSRKTEVLSIKTTKTIKVALRQMGEREHRSMANMLEALVMDYYARHGLTMPTDEEISTVSEEPTSQGRP